MRGCRNWSAICAWSSADETLTLSVVDSAAALVPGQGGLPTLRLDLHLSAPLPEGWQREGVGGYVDRNYNDRLGWREIVIQGGPGVAIAANERAGGGCLE